MVVLIKVHVTAVSPHHSHTASPICSNRICTRLLSLLDYLNLFAFVMEPQKSEHPHFYDNFIFSNYRILDNPNTIVVFEDHPARIKSFSGSITNTNRFN